MIINVGESSAKATSYDNSESGLEATNVQEAIDGLKKSVSNGKSTVASAITTKGVTTASDATFDTMASNIKNIPNANSDTYTPTSRAAALDMGAANAIRYINTNSVPNVNSGTYTPTSNGSALDMGYNNTYRYVNTNTVYNSGYNNGVWDGRVNLNGWERVYWGNHSSTLSYTYTATGNCLVFVYVTAGQSNGNTGEKGIGISTTGSCLMWDGGSVINDGNKRVQFNCGLYRLWNGAKVSPSGNAGNWAVTTIGVWRKWI